MKKSYLTIAIILISITAAVVFWPKQKTEIPPQQKETQQLSPTSAGGNFETQSNSEGGVTIKVTPQNINDGSFFVVLDTHSVELSDDLTKIAILKDENGKEYRPMSWEGAPSGGHHREGILKFGSLLPTPKKIELVISGIGDITERKFLWIILF